MINIRVQGVEDVEIFLKRLDKNLQDVNSPLEKSARYMENQARANFPAKGRIMSEGWKDYAPPGWRVAKSGKKYWFPGTEEIKRKAGFGGQPLMVRTENLKNSFLTMGPRVVKGGGEVEVYNPISYAVSHQEGMGKLPRRVLLKFMKTHITEISKIFITWVKGAINKSF